MARGRPSVDVVTQAAAGSSRDVNIDTVAARALVVFLLTVKNPRKVADVNESIMIRFYSWLKAITSVVAVSL